MSGYCNWCDSTTNSIIKVFESGVLIWIGCNSCYEKQKEALKHDGPKK